MRLLGRERERAALDRLVESARDGSGGALVVHGEPGVGKTALLEDSVEKDRKSKISSFEKTLPLIRDDD